MEKVRLNVKVRKIYSYEAPGYGYNKGYETHYIYVMQGEDGKIYVWKTTKVMRILNREFDCCPREENKIYEGDELHLTAYLKAHSMYKGVPQILVTKVEVIERMIAVLNPEEKLNCQLESIMPWDEVKEVSYKDYKNKYSKCETVLYSYDASNKTIKIIIRNKEVA